MINKKELGVREMRLELLQNSNTGLSPGMTRLDRERGIKIRNVRFSFWHVLWHDLQTSQTCVHASQA